MGDLRFQTIVTAGLLHDIGKFVQRGDFGSLSATGKHPQVSRDFVSTWKEFFGRFCDAELLLELVARHHENREFPEELQVAGAADAIRPLAYMVSRADNYSSAERDDGGFGGGQAYKRVALASVFSRIELDKPNPDVVHYRLARLGTQAAFPEKGAETVDETPYKNLLKEFGEAFRRFAQDPGITTFDHFYLGLLRLLQTYTWCVPSSTMDALPDVSLYDHLRTTSAISAALYRFHEENSAGYTVDDKEKFRLIVGDLSGIQKYIFRPVAKGQGGVAKRLRARSFYLSLLPEVVGHMLVQAFDLPVANIIFSSGGKFYVLVPNTAKSGELVRAVQERIDAELFVRFHGELALNMADIAFSGLRFDDFGQVMAELGMLLGKRKTAAFESIMKTDRQWNEDSFVFREGGELQPCTVCGKVHAQGGECDDCLQDLNIGGKLPKTMYLSFFRGDFPSQAIEIFEGYAVSLDKQVIRHSPSPYLVQNLNESGKPSPYPEMIRYMAKYVPTDTDERVTEFDAIAESSIGIPLLGCLKADVDYLGMIFQHGLRETGEAGRNYASISRIATLSRMLEIFFSQWVEETLSSKGYQYCYTVYSGGDDLLIVGPWDRTFELAGTVEAAFRKFTGTNPNITLSAGMSLFKPHYPIDMAVGHAEELLEDSKLDRNRVTLFGQTMTWEEYRQAKTEGLKWAGWRKQDWAPASLLYRLRRYGDLFATEQWECESLLAYDIARNIRGRGKDEIENWLKNLLTAPHQHMDLLRPITTYALYSNRGGKEHDV